MSLLQQDADRLLDLLNEIWDRGPSQERCDAILEFVHEHGASARNCVLDYTDLHAELATSMASIRAHDNALSQIRAMASPGGDEHGEKLRMASLQAITLGATFKPTWIASAAVAALLLIAVGFQAVKQEQPASAPTTPAVAMRTLVRPPQPVACLTEATKAVWSNNASYKLRETFRQGHKLMLLSGTAQISMASGADIVLQSPCSVVLAADDRVELENGKLTAQAAKWATGFVVETKGLVITDLGTTFAVSADKSGVAEAHVLEGAVLAEPMKTYRPKRSSMLLKKGEAIRVSLPKSTIDLIAAKRTAFIDHLHSFRPLRPIPIWNTGVGQQLGQGDAHWTIVQGDATSGPYPRPAVITHGDPSYLDNMPESSQWVSVGLDPGAAPKSVHTFETQFDLTDYDLATVRIVGLFLVDDAIRSLRINGKSVPFEPWIYTWDDYDFRRFHAIEISDGFVPGKNVVAIDVYNLPSQSEPESSTAPNPLGLRVEWQAFGAELLE